MLGTSPLFRIGDARYHNRYRGGRFLGSLSRRGIDREDDVDHEPYEFIC